MPKLKIVCAWCNKELGEKEGAEGITHGICDDCLLHHFPHHYEKIKGILEVENIEDIYAKRRMIMAKKAKCDKCKIKWNIQIKDQTPLRELACNQCGGPVTPIYSPCNYKLARGEPVLNQRR